MLNDGFAPVWACLSAGTLANFPVLGGLEALTVFADNDTPGAQAAEACVARWRAAGKEARVVAPPRQLPRFCSTTAEGAMDYGCKESNYGRVLKKHSPS